ncbi:hypothetical protein B296_00000596 [Ensete ventricosum]|uniref:Glycosyl transferase CAP10 domain-containing protein n=1 Tax=Ensete ventricosum TaxID=4639 RepID=A0A427BBT3_ENSVE|nr:hypothetical protein B296_00000596 [Ensete ventricosum]
MHFCRRRITPSPSPSAASTSGTEPPPFCPDYFRWIHEDLRPWNPTGITRKMVESARQFAAFRLLVIGGRVYVDQYHRVFQTRDLFTLWGFVQLATRYPGRLPDLDLMFNCEDMPTVKADDYNTSHPPPPLFRYCKDDSTVDIVFPDWSFWGCNFLDDRYKIFVEGRAWSVSSKYILACDSPALFVTTHFHDFLTRGLMPGRHYWPIGEDNQCRSIKFAVDWGNKHQEKVQAMGKEGSSFILEEVKMEFVYQYMLHLLTEYAKLLRYEPTLPENATELCLESLACGEEGRVREFLMQAMVKWTSDSEPCTLPPPYSPGALEQLRSRKADAIKQVQEWEQEA